jgi:hypothetical protein
MTSSGTDLDSALAELRTALSFDAAPEQLCDWLIDQFGQDKPDDVDLFVLHHP